MPVHLRIERAGSDSNTSLRVLSRLLTTVQTLAFGLGKERVETDPRFSDRTERDVRRECELFVTDLRYGSFEATLDVAPLPEELFPAQRPEGLGEVVVGDLNLLAAALAANDAAATRRLLRNPARRGHLLRALGTSLPPPAEYGVTWSGRDVAGSDVIYPFALETLESETLLGETARERAADEVVIEGTCVARLGKDGKPDVREWLGFSVLEPESGLPYETDRITWRGQVFVLKREISCPVTVEDHLVVVRYEPLGIRAYASTREAAVSDFAEEFACLWDGYAQARDEDLTRRAAALKRLLRSLVKEVLTIETSEGQAGRGQPQT